MRLVKFFEPVVFSGMERWCSGQVGCWCRTACSGQVGCWCRRVGWLWSRVGGVHVGAWFSDHRSIWLVFSWTFDSIGEVASTCAMPINPIMSKGETTMVRDLDLVNRP